MSVLAHKWVSSGKLAGKAAFADARVCVILHGILGSGRNWMGPAKRIVDARPDWKCLLVDHRCHGGSPPADGALRSPHASARARLDACAADVEATISFATGEGTAPTPSNASAALLPCGGAPIVLGHSFGGKVALAYAQRRRRRRTEGGGCEPPIKTWLLDSAPGERGAREREAPSGPGRVLAALERAAARGRDAGGFADRADVRAALAAEGLDPLTAAWLAQSVRRRAEDEARLEFGYDLPGVRLLFEAFGGCDMWEDCVDLARARGGRLGLVVAGDPRAGMWEGTEERRAALQRSAAGKGSADAVVHYMPRAGHNLHVDDLDGLLHILLNQHQEDWNY